VEAGISQRYVALALDELRAKPAGQALGPSVSPFRERLATRLLGTSQRTVAVTRTFRSPPRAVLQALGRTWQSHPWSLTLRDTLGGHPLEGGVLLFDMPNMTGTGDYKWTWTRFGVFAPQLRASIAPVPGDSRACEVTITIDLREGLSPNMWGYGVIAGGGASVSSLIGFAIAKKAMAMAGAALLGPAGAAGVLVGAALLAFTGPMYRWEIRKAEAELQAVLAALDGGMRALDIFGEAPPTLPPPPRPSSGDEIITIIS